MNKFLKARKAGASAELVYAVAFVVIIIVILVALLLVRAEAGDTTTQQGDVGNIAPVVDSVAVGDSSQVENNNITLTENVQTTLYVFGAYTDQNSCQDANTASNWNIQLRDGALSANCSPSDSQCYTLNTTTNLTISDCTGPNDTTGTYEGTVQLYYFANAANWFADVTANDGTANSNLVSDGFAIASNNALEVTSAAVNYGSVSINALGTDQSVVLRNTGNTPNQDYQVIASNFSCANGASIAASTTHVSTSAISDQTAYDAASVLDTSTPVYLNVNAVKQAVSATPTETTLHFNSKPNKGEGVCSNTITFTAATN